VICSDSEIVDYSETDEFLCWFAVYNVFGNGYI